MRGETEKGRVQLIIFLSGIHPTGWSLGAGDNFKWVEDSNATEESKLLTPCSWKIILESHGKRNYIPWTPKIDV